MKHILKFLCILAVLVMMSCGIGNGGGVPMDFVKTFEGRFDNRSEMVMKLISNNGTISGMYFLRSAGKNIDVRGSLTKQGEIRLEELDEYGEPTGVFIGKFVDENKIEGTWSESDGDRSKSFFLLVSNSNYESEKNRNRSSYSMTDGDDDSNTASDGIRKAYASTTMNSSYGITYSADNVHDGDLKTWWSPATAYKQDSWITLELNRERTVSGIRIHAGSHYPSFKNMGDLYPQNMRIKEARIDFSDGSHELLRFDDVDEIQEVSFKIPRTIDRFTLRILSAYPSNNWQDYCISHLTPVYND